ncbi:MAG: hypothetical protein O7G85_13020, partial [Planctomycetota bacterium]|nr:hypothetical protein [Planctomycetota bacterium]
GDLMPLRRLVQFTDLRRAEESEVRLIYHQSYAFVTWLSRYRQEELRKYLQLMKLMPPGTPSREKHLSFFSRCFGDVDKLERVWLKHEYKLYVEYQTTQVVLVDDDSIR